MASFVRCARCLMPNTRPGTLFLDGICGACINYEARQKVDWKARWAELEALCAKYRGWRPYDCAVAVSGGKDSHYLLDLVVNRLKMAPLLIRTGDGFGMSSTGRANLDNLKRFAPLLEFTPDAAAVRATVRAEFEALGNLPFVDSLVYSVPVRLASILRISLLFYGENPYHEYAGTAEDLIALIPNSLLTVEPAWRALVATLPQPRGSSSNPSCVFVSRFEPWSSWGHYELALTMGFQPLPPEDWPRLGSFETWDSVDSIGWWVAPWLKAIKFGFGRATDLASRLVREGRMGRKEALYLVAQNDPELDPRALGDFCRVAGLSEADFFVTARRFYNKSLFVENDLPRPRYLGKEVF